MEEEAAGTRLDVQRRLSDGCHAPLSRYRLQRHLVIGPHRPAAIASLHRRSMAASRGLLISLKKRSSRQLLLDGRQTAPYSRQCGAAAAVPAFVLTAARKLTYSWILARLARCDNS